MCFLGLFKLTIFESLNFLLTDAERTRAPDLTPMDFCYLQTLSFFQNIKTSC